MRALSADAPGFVAPDRVGGNHRQAEMLCIVVRPLTKDQEQH